MKNIELFIVRIIWLFTPKENRQPWDKVLNAMIPHEHKYTIKDKECGVDILRCEHYGCNMVDVID